MVVTLAYTMLRIAVGILYVLIGTSIEIDTLRHSVPVAEVLVIGRRIRHPKTSDICGDWRPLLNSVSVAMTVTSFPKSRCDIGADWSIFRSGLTSMRGTCSRSSDISGVTRPKRRSVPVSLSCPPWSAVISTAVLPFSRLQNSVTC